MRHFSSPPKSLVCHIGDCLQAFKATSTAEHVSLQDDIITLKVNKLSSTKAQLPYEYYSLPYCRPSKIISSAENLGEVLRGDRIENSLYQVHCGDCIKNSLHQALSLLRL